ncbi:unnamed protein product, partial [Ectocarpus sp. 12 AP-2014]
MSDTPQDLAAALLDAARKAGADAADALAVEATAQAIDVRGGTLEQAERAEYRDLSLRVFLGQRSASISGSDIRPDAMSEMATRAVAMAREAPEDPYIGLADPGQLATDRDATPLDLCDPSDEPAPAELEDDARRAEAAALATQGITRIDSAAAQYNAQRIALAATNGFSGSY